MNDTTTRQDTTLSTDPLVVLAHESDGTWLLYPATASALSVQPARRAAFALGYEHREPYRTLLTEWDGVQMDGVEMFAKSHVRMVSVQMFKTDQT